MKAKKVISMFLAGVMALGLLAGCSSTAEDSQTNETQQETQNEADTTANGDGQTDTTETTDHAEEANTEEGAGTETEASADESGKTLVVYYSATGNTETVANAIAEATGGELFKLEPSEPYTDADLDWTDDNSRVSVEHDNEDERDVELVADTVDNWESYDTVFIGYPIWWGIAAWPVDTFVKANDFTGKTVIPFATSSSSGMGESGELLAEMAQTGEWQEGERFRSGVSESDVQAWVENLGL